jgi:DNA polymerase III subunit delta
MIIFIYGEDTYSSKEKLKALKDKFTKEVDSSGLNLAEFDGAKVTLEDFKQAVTAQPFMAKKRMVVVRNLLASKRPADLYADLQEFLKREQDTIMIFWEQSPEKKLGFFKFLKSAKYSYELKPLEPASLTRWIKKRADEAKVSIEPGAISVLGAWVGNDLWRLSHELEKLAAYKAGSKILKEDVEELVEGDTTASIFEITDAVAVGNKPKALKLINQELARGMNELYLLTMLVRQFRILYMLREAQDAGRANQQELSRELGLHPFVVKKSLPQAKRYSIEQLKNIYGKLLDIDLKLKTTSLKPELLFDLLVVEK